MEQIHPTTDKKSRSSSPATILSSLSNPKTTGTDATTMPYVNNAVLQLLFEQFFVLPSTQL